MIIREAKKQDYEDLCSLLEQVDRLHRDNLPQIFQKTDGPARQREYLLGLIGTENMGVFVAVDGDKLLGFINLFVRSSTDIPILVARCFALIENLVVDERCRRRGIGRALLEHAQKWAVEQGATSIELTVYEFNRSARIYYEHMGYETESRRMSRKL